MWTAILSDYLEKRVVVVRQLPITAYFTFLSIPTEEILQEMRDPAREIFYLVTTPKGKIQQYEKKWLHLPWQLVCPGESDSAVWGSRGKRKTALS
jgi:hypothetical protein